MTLSLNFDQYGSSSASSTRSEAAVAHQSIDCLDFADERGIGTRLRLENHSDALTAASAYLNGSLRQGRW